MSPKSPPLPWLAPGIFVGGLVPLAVILWRGAHGQLGADLVAVVLNQFGYLALTFLTASLLCTPLKIITGWTWSIRIRRMLGLFAFFYASLHFLTYVGVDQSFDLSSVISDITKRKFIFVGFAAFLLLIPLAITSTNKMVRRLGFVRWKLLHRLAYIAGCLGAIHFILRVKKDVREPVIFATVIGSALAVRTFDVIRQRLKKRSFVRAVPD